MDCTMYIRGLIKFVIKIRGEHSRNVVAPTGPGNKFKVRIFSECASVENIPALYLLTV